MSEHLKELTLEMMGYGYDGGGVWMWVFGGLMMVGVLLVIGMVVWAIMTATTRGNAAPTAPADPGGRARARQVLDERYARGEMTSEEYSERLHTLGL